MAGLVVDVTQFCRQPARSGVQRALLEMARAWPTTPATTFVARVDAAFRGLPPEEFAAVVARYFAAGNPAAAEEVHARFRAARRVSAAEVASSAVVLPEPTYDPEVVQDLAARTKAGQHVVAVGYDCFPQTHPWAFEGNGQRQTSAYYRLLATVPVAVATSSDVGEMLVGRLRRAPATTPTVWLGTDHVVASRAERTRAVADVLMVGTVEPRKRVPLAVEAVSVLRAAVPHARLVLLGRPGVEEPAFLRRLRRLSDEQEWLDWQTDADDHQLAEAMATATVLLAVGDEGYGLPVVEALLHGCPAVVAGMQPAASLVQGRGAWQAHELSAEAVAQALEPWCEPTWAAAHRSKIDVGGLPRWRQFAEELVGHAAG